MNINNNYFRITAYYKEEDFSVILDSNGRFEKLWQFSAYLIEKGFEILEVSKAENILDINITPTTHDGESFILRAIAEGKPEYVEHTINGVKYTAIKVGDGMYMINQKAKI